MWYNENIYCTKYSGTYTFTIYCPDGGILLQWPKYVAAVTTLKCYLWSQKNIKNEHRIKCPLQRHKLCFGCRGSCTFGALWPSGTCGPLRDFIAKRIICLFTKMNSNTNTWKMTEGFNQHITHSNTILTRLIQA